VAAATKPNPALEETQPCEPTALSAVFRRLAKDEPAPKPEPGTRVERLGEPVAEAPRVEMFLSEIAEADASIAADSAVVVAAETSRIEVTIEDAEPARPPPTARVVRESPPASPSVRDPPPTREPAPLVTRARLPTGSDASAERQNLRGRVRGWLGEAPPAFESLTGADAAAPPARSLIGPADQSVASGALSVRAGHPSMPRNRRLYRRVQLAAEMEIAGVPCTLIDVSIGGFAATGVPALEPNSHVQATIRLTIDGIEVGTQLNARIIYVSHGRSSGRFVELTASQTAFLRYIVTWRGESVGAVGTTTLLDAISGGLERPGAFSRSNPPRGHWWSGWGRRKANKANSAR
jgi:hypothetical protein